MRNKSLIAAVLLCTMMSSLHAQYSLDFDGSNDDVNLGTGINFSGSDDFTVSMWVNPDNFTNTPTFIRSGASGQTGKLEIKFAANTSGNIRAGIDYYGVGWGGTSSTYSSDALSSGSWNYIAFTKDDDVIKLYVNGSASGSVTWTQSGYSLSDVNAGEDNWYLGKDQLAGEGYYFDGKMDEVAAWNTALSADAVAAIYNSGDGLDVSSNSGDYS